MSTLQLYHDYLAAEITRRGVVDNDVNRKRVVRDVMRMSQPTTQHPIEMQNFWKVMLSGEPL